jgi:zinc protease
VEASGLGNFSHTELIKALAGKVASATLSMSTYRTNVNGSSTPKDVETMLQLAYLYMTANIKKDQKSVDQLMRTMEVQLKNRLLQPEAVFADSLNVTATSHNPRFRNLDVDDLKDVDYDRILRMAKERTANAAAFTFTIIGNYNDSTIRPLIEQYIASLPAQNMIPEKGSDVATDYTGKVVNDFKHKGETPKAIAVLNWYTKQLPYTLRNSIRAHMAGQVLQMVYLKEIREEASASYTVVAQASLNRSDFADEANLLAYCPMKPEKADTAIAIMRRAVQDMAAGKIDADMVKKVKEYMLKSHADQLKQNGYWQGRISVWRKWGLDFHTDYVKTVQAITPASICGFVREVLKAGNELEVVMLPAE